MKLDVYGAGCYRVNHSYIAVPLPKGLKEGLYGQFFFTRNDGGPECISWFSDSGEFGKVRGSWPAGWYMQTELEEYGIYFLPSEQPEQLPLIDWESCIADR